MNKVTVRAGSNIAFIKYWGVADPAINLPLSSSISMTLADAYTVTTVERQPTSWQNDQYVIDGSQVPAGVFQRLCKHVDYIRELAGSNDRVKVASENNFPKSAGIASSASGFAALTVAACDAFGLNVSDSRLSQIARRGSGSACRSIFGGYVQWDRGKDDTTSVARQLFSAQHWELVDLVAIVSHEEKAVSSASGHVLASGSPLNHGRISKVNQMLPELTEALARRDLATLGRLIELDALSMHAVMMTSRPSLLYWLPGTLDIIHSVRSWRQEGLEAYFTIDAGPNVHVLCESANAQDVQNRLERLSSVQTVIVSRPGDGPSTTDDHLF